MGAANAAWREGLSTTGAAENGAATWNWLARGRIAWAGGNPSGAPLPVYPGNLTTQPLASLTIAPADLHDGDTIAFDLPSPSFLGDWIAHPETNAGFLLTCPTLEGGAPSSRGQILFYSDDSTAPARRPRLDLFYDPRTAAADGSWLSSE